MFSSHTWLFLIKKKKNESNNLHDYEHKHSLTWTGGKFQVRNYCHSFQHMFLIIIPLLSISQMIQFNVNEICCCRSLFLQERNTVCLSVIYCFCSSRHKLRAQIECVQRICIFPFYSRCNCPLPGQTIHNQHKQIPPPPPPTHPTQSLNLCQIVVLLSSLPQLRDTLSLH